MIEAYIIEKIRQQEEEQRRDLYERPALELPLPLYQPTHQESETQPEPKRVIVIEL